MAKDVYKRQIKANTQEITPRPPAAAKGAAMTDQLARILPGVQKPARYVGGEYNEIIKDKQSVTTRVAFCFPDTYEIGMSNLGMRILYGIMNEMPGVWCERVFAPWGDMDAALRAHQLPLFALESKDPLTAFDLIAFTIGYEMSYTNILNMLQLAGIPLRSADRPGLNQLIIAGGTCAYNPEPLADFIAVSYTHLDVYKRQGHRRSGPRNGALCHSPCGSQSRTGDRAPPAAPYTGPG